jgi:phosphoglycolate phosphatase-like HAD superfamily hydrolase
MDGTLTCPGAIDFAAMRSRCGVPAGMDIIAHVDAHSADPAEQARLHSILVEEEEKGLAKMRLMDGAVELIAGLTRAGVKRALLTRNNEDAMHRTVALLLNGETTGTTTSLSSPSSPSSSPFHVMLSRSFTPCKPHPAPLLSIAQTWGLDPSEMVMVGDSIDDMECGRRAGAATILIGEPDHPHTVEGRQFADAEVASLAELQELLLRWLDPAHGGTWGPV